MVERMEKIKAISVQKYTTSNNGRRGNIFFSYKVKKYEIVKGNFEANEFKNKKQRRKFQIFLHSHFVNNSDICYLFQYTTIFIQRTHLHIIRIVKWIITIFESHTNLVCNKKYISLHFDLAIQRILTHSDTFKIFKKCNFVISVFQLMKMIKIMQENDICK